MKNLFKSFYIFLFGDGKELTKEEKQKERERKALMLGARGKVTFETKEENKNGNDKV